MANSILAAVVTAGSHYFERAEMPQLIHFYSDSFGKERRLEYLNFIRLKEGADSSRIKVLQFFNDDPILARRVMISMDIALRSIQCIGAAFLVLTAVGSGGAVAIGITALALTPIVTKVLQYKWSSLETLDAFLQRVVIVAAVVTSFAMMTLTSYLIAGSLACGFAFSHSFSLEKSHPEVDWEYKMFYVRKEKEFLERKETLTVDELDKALIEINKFEINKFQIKNKAISNTQTDILYHQKCRLEKLYLERYVAKRVEELTARLEKAIEEVDLCTPDNHDRVLVPVGLSFVAHLQALYHRMQQLIRAERVSPGYDAKLPEMKQRFSGEIKTLTTLFKTMSDRFSKAFPNQFSLLEMSTGVQWARAYNLCHSLADPLGTEANPKPFGGLMVDRNAIEGLLGTTNLTNQEALKNLEKARLARGD